MDTGPEKYVQKVLEASRNKYLLLQDILEQTRDITKALDDESDLSLDGLISERQLKMQQIDKLDEDFEFYFKRLKYELGVEKIDDLNNPKISGIRELKETVAGILSLLNEIKVLDENNKAKGKALLKDIESEIIKLNQGKKVNNAYTPKPMSTTSYFIDKMK